ncbi:aromatic-ring-hydroxylating dioxygenase subunit beta [Burkholderia sp. BCC0044]|uniref:aromatic-ring-hydroxylating dioxygenase subunit beta n=1 Tax=Burkholderia sp. BCC0044 TaxID=2676295 RepID=UPI001588CD18|nr:aromatic-ring-hydroxylating dioxygenase subunit beta [Burkholderia sp. BCC0044]
MTISSAWAGARLAPRDTGTVAATFADFYGLVDLNARYASALDRGDWDAWPEFFEEDCTYQLLPRENHERDFPLALLAFESKGMLKDRVYGIKETLFYDPYYQRHLIGTPLITYLDESVIEAETNYAVLRTKSEQMSDVYNTGRYLDRIRRTPHGLRFESRICVYDSEMVPNSIIYPI